MKSIFLVRNGKSDEAFEMSETPMPKPGEFEVLVKVETFGLNFADVMARKGLYNDAPPLPAVLGYEVVGRIEELGSGVTGLQIGQKVVAFTRFGGYAEYCLMNQLGVAVIPEDYDNEKATALATQYTTAFFAAHRMTNLLPSDTVLIHAAAGGVGTALIQLAKRQGCRVIGTVGSAEKLEYIKKQGADEGINYREADFEEAVKRILGKKRVDVIFDPVGGKSFKKGMRLLGSGGRMVTYGASNWTDKKGNIIDKLRLVWDFGFLHPLGLMMKSKAVIGVNMLRISENCPELIQECMQNVIDLAVRGELDPTVGGSYKAENLAAAHHFLESRDSIGKVVVNW